MLGVTVRVWGAVPEPGLTDIHEASSDAVNDSVPLPAFDTAIVFAAGSAPPAVALNDRLAGVVASAGPVGAGPTVNVTGTTFGEPVAPAAVIVTLAVYVPAVSNPTFGATETDPGAVPPPGVTVTHDWSAAAVYESDPPPLLVIDRLCGAGSAPPWLAENERLDGPTASV